MNNLSGVVPAVLTPLTADGDLNAHSFERLLAALYAKGSHGMYVCGQTGEGLQLPVSVRERATEIAVANKPNDACVIIHVGGATTADAVRLAKHASHAGADAISSLPPGSAYRFEEVRAYYEALAASSSVPVLVYFFPEFSSSIRTLEQVLELCAVPGVVGLKFTDFDLYRLSLIQRAGHVIFSGRDEVFAAGMLMGAHGGIGSFYNLVPDLFLSVYNHARAGKWKEVRAAQDRINDLIRAVLSFPMLAAMKQLLSWSGIDCGVPVPPRRALTAEEASRLCVAVKSAGFEPKQFLQ